MGSTYTRKPGNHFLTTSQVGRPSHLSKQTRKGQEEPLILVLQPWRSAPHAPLALSFCAFTPRENLHLGAQSPLVWILALLVPHRVAGSRSKIPTVPFLCLFSHSWEGCFLSQSRTSSPIHMPAQKSLHKFSHFSQCHNVFSHCSSGVQLLR